MVDCDDEQKLCEFYHRLLGWEQSQMFGRPALRNKDGIVFLFLVGHVKKHVMSITVSCQL